VFDSADVVGLIHRKPALLTITTSYIYRHLIKEPEALYQAVRGLLPEKEHRRDAVHPCKKKAFSEK
jgi:hypothetical protein